jgi:hypothetical protein
MPQPRPPAHRSVTEYRNEGNPLDPNDVRATMVKPGELIDVREMKPLTLYDRRNFNLLVANAWDEIEEDKDHVIPKSKGSGNFGDLSLEPHLVDNDLRCSLPVPFCYRIWQIVSSGPAGRPPRSRSGWSLSGTPSGSRLRSRSRGPG